MLKKELVPGIFIYRSEELNADKILNFCISDSLEFNWDSWEHTKNRKKHIRSKEYAEYHKYKNVSEYTEQNVEHILNVFEDMLKNSKVFSIEERYNIIAQIDMGRKYRKGIPEVIFAERKTTDEIKKIIVKVMEKSDCVLISRIQKKDYSKIVKFVRAKKLSIRDGKNTTTILIHKSSLKKNGGKVGIVTAGTSDIGVAEEARLTCEAMHCDTITTYDVGIAGLHRIFPIIKKFIESDVDTIIVAAGMEGALASVVSSLVNIPVIGLPTSVGYGYGEKGVASLASMLQSCSLGLSVVNIDNGIGAGAVASNIANRVRRR